MEESEKKQYKHANEVITDLTKVIPIIDAHSKMCITPSTAVSTQHTSIAYGSPDSLAHRHLHVQPPQQLINGGEAPAKRPAQR